MACSAGQSTRIFALALAGRSLRLQQWDDAYIVYQPPSTETHVFNETTALILRCLELGPRSADEVTRWTEAALGVDQGGLAADDFAFALGRLEELGLIEPLDEAIARQ
jgi:PqqD family protein of HPr-rel-A system